jgi:tetratricopeptide (TPR) repeat protein
MLPEVEEPARPIRDLDNVRAVLASVHASSVELLECAEVAKRLKNSELRMLAAKRFLDQLTHSRQVSSLDILRAAEHVIYSKFGEVQDLETLKNHLQEADEWLQKLLKNGPKFERLDDLRMIVSTTLLLAADASTQSRVELCSALRKLECSPVAVKVIESVIEEDPSNTYALTTYGAALIDINEARKACKVLNRVLQIKPRSTHALTALSRAFNQIDKPRQAHEHALIAFSIEVNVFTAHRLLTSAAMVEDEKAFEDALYAVKSNLDQQNEAFSRNVLLVSAEELLDGGKFDSASRAITELRTFRWRGEQAKRVARLSRWLDGFNSPQLF